MQTELFNTLQHIQAAFAAEENEVALRAALQTYFDAIQHCARTAKSDEALLLARVGGLQILRALQNRAMPQSDAPVFALSLSALCESVSFCADLLCASQKRVFFTGETEVFAACRPHAALWATLNLLSDALLHSTGRYVFLRAARTGNKAVLTVSGEGEFSLPAFYAAQNRTGGGLRFAAQTAKLHGGGLYLCASAAFSTVAFSLPVAAPHLPPWQLPDFTDWLSDGLSPIYIALCDSIFPHTAT